MKITVEQFKTYIFNARNMDYGLQNCCHAFVYHNQADYKAGYEVVICHSILDGDLVLSDREYNLFFDNSLDAHAFAISYANFNYLQAGRVAS